MPKNRLFFIWRRDMSLIWFNSTTKQNKLNYPIRDNIAFKQNRTVSWGLPSFYVITLLYYIILTCECTLGLSDTYSSGQLFLVFCKKKSCLGLHFRFPISVVAWGGMLMLTAFAPISIISV